MADGEPALYIKTVAVVRGWNITLAYVDAIA